MKRILTISDLDGFADICNETNFALTAGAGECRGPADNKSDAEREAEKRMEGYLDAHGPFITFSSR